MMKFISVAFLFTLLFWAGCYSTQVSTSGAGTGIQADNARNWVLIMHGESCGNADDVASNMYVENSHDSATIVVVVDISWTENSQPRHENKTLTVAPNSKTLIGCDLRNGTYLKMEIATARYQ